MGAPLLLVADDLAIIASIKRVLGREGYEIVLATNAADAVIAWGHHLPALVLLQPSVESDRGGVALEELQNHPEARLLRVLLLGETIPGFGYQVEPLPVDPDHFAQTVAAAMRAPDTSESWTVTEPRRQAPPLVPRVAPGPVEPELWRATRPANQPAPATPPLDVPERDAEPTPPPAAPPEPRPTVPTDLGARLFNDLPELEDELHRGVEAEAIASVESSLANLPADDDELQDLEDDVRAEAHRRRSSRSSLIEAPPTTLSAAADSPTPDDETSFADVAEPTTGEMPAPSLTPSAEEQAQAAVLLARADAMVLEGREVAQRQHSVDEADRKRRESELEAVGRRAERAEELVRKERDSREAAEEDASKLRDGQRALEEKLAEADAAIDASRLDREELTKELDAAQKAEATLRTMREQAAALDMQLAEEREAHEAVRESERAARSELDEARAIAARFEQAQARAEKERMVAEDRAAALKAEVQAAAKHRAALEAQEQHLTGALKEHGERLQERDAIATRASEDLQAAGTTIAALREEHHAARDALTTLRGELEGLRSRAEQAEAEAELAKERLAELERQRTMPIALPGRRPLGVPRSGTVELEALAQLVGQLVLAEADVRVELAVEGGTRTLWLKRGHVVAADSTFEAESVLTRARRDGLLDARQEGELRLLRGATATEQLEALKARGFVRDTEVVPLVQRFTEQIALEALGEPASQYRLADEAVGAGVLAAAAPRATMPLLAEAVRRVLPAETLLERLGGGEAVPVPKDAELDLRLVGFADRERKMLTWVDGEATVEDLALASGLRPDAAYRALLVSRMLGVISVEPGRPKPQVSSPQLDVERLEAKFEEVQDADYFTILGLSRAAGSDEVQRAFGRLALEFDPLRYSGHPDASLQQRAQVVHAALEEAARALEDDRRRAEYARHLMD